jgi:hypothetical protein
MSGKETPTLAPQHPTHHRLAATNAAVHTMLHSRLLHRLLDRAVCELRFNARRTGTPVRLPVMYARDDRTLVVLVGGSAGKTWWRTFTRPHRVEVYLDGGWQTGLGRTIAFGEPGRGAAMAAYRHRYPDVTIDDADPFVMITLGEPQPAVAEHDDFVQVEFG